MTAQILSYSRSKGLFAGLALEGAVLRPSNDDNKALYGKEVSPKEILIAGTVAPPPTAEPLIALLSGQRRSPAPAAAATTTPPAPPRTGSGSIVGVVRDTSGAVIPDAVITITNAATNASRWVTSNAEGRFTVPGLAAGDYVIKAQATGMKTITTTPIPLEAGGNQDVDFQLEPGP